MNNILKRISKDFSSLPRQQQKVATFILARPNDVAFLTLESTAEKSDVSTTTVLRFVRRMGYAGFTDFQKQIQSDMRVQQGTLVDKFNRLYTSVSRDELLLNTFSKDIHNINRTMMEMPLDQLKRAVELIVNAKHVYINGLRESHALAHYAFTRLMTIRPYVSLLARAETEMPEPLLTLGEEDVCIHFLFMRYTRKSVEILNELRRSKIPVILITSPDYTALADLADVILPCYVEGNSLKNTSAAPISLINYIANAVVDYDYEKSFRFLAQVEEILIRNNILC